jgi:RimJ/RimL family protein N-acetyltransferase
MSSFGESDMSTRMTCRLRLRPPSPADLNFMVDQFGRPELVAHRLHPEPDSPEASRARLERDIGHWRQHGFGRWAIRVNGRAGGLKGPA